MKNLNLTLALINNVVKYKDMNDTQLDQTFAALAHPVRRAILERLSGGTASVNELAAPFEMSLPAVSRHIKILERAGLITRSQSAQFRPCRLELEPLKALVSWTEQYRQIWEARFDQMDHLIKQNGKTKDAE